MMLVRLFLLFFLAHLSYAQDELWWSLFVRHPSVRLSVNTLNDNSSKAIEAIIP